MTSVRRSLLAGACFLILSYPFSRIVLWAYSPLLPVIGLVSPAVPLVERMRSWYGPVLLHTTWIETPGFEVDGGKIIKVDVDEDALVQMWAETEAQYRFQLIAWIMWCAFPVLWLILTRKRKPSAV